MAEDDSGGLGSDLGDMSPKAQEQVRELIRKARAEERSRERSRLEAKQHGVYWDKLSNVFRPVLDSFSGSYNKYKYLRQVKEVSKYRYLRHLLNTGNDAGEGMEVYGDVDSFYDDNTTITAILTDVQGREAERAARVAAGQGNRNQDRESARHHLKTLRGFAYANANKSRAHLLPEDSNCYVFWWLMLLFVIGVDIASVLITGEGGRSYCAPNLAILKNATKMETNKLLFDEQHNHFFDLMDMGIILAIPIFPSIEEMSRGWDHKTPFELLILCDGADAFRTVGITMTRDHVIQAEWDDVDKAAGIVSVFTKILADSLVDKWDSFFNIVPTEDESRRDMLRLMRDKIRGGEILVPAFKQPAGEGKPKLYKISFEKLLKDEAARYIPDPFLLSIKAAANWSFFAYSDTKLLPAGTVDSDSESLSEGSQGLTTQTEAILDFTGAVIHVVSDEEDGNENESACSDITLSKM